MRIFHLFHYLLWLSVFVLTVARADAEDVIIDADSGAVFDGVLDGFPSIAPFDGTPDFGGNQLGTVLKNGVTEERGIGEFSLEALSAVSATALTRPF